MYAVDISLMFLNSFWNAHEDSKNNCFEHNKSNCMRNLTWLYGSASVISAFAFAYLNVKKADLFLELEKWDCG